MADLGLGVLLVYTAECVSVFIYHSIQMGYLVLSAFIHFYEDRIFGSFNGIFPMMPFLYCLISTDCILVTSLALFLQDSFSYSSETEQQNVSRMISSKEKIVNTHTLQKYKQVGILVTDRHEQYKCNFVCTKLPV